MRQFILLATIALAACNPVQPKRPTTPVPSAPPAAGVAVIDVATYDIDGKRYRLRNVDGPQLAPAAKCSAEAALAIHAARAAEEALDRHPTRIIHRSGVDAEGRLLAQILLRGDTDLGVWLIGQGYAAARSGGPWDWCGPVNYDRVGGPSLDYGPEANKAYTSWTVAHPTATHGAGDPKRSEAE